MNDRDVFVLADRALAAVVAQVREEQWDLLVPPWFPRSDTGERPNLRRIVGYHAYEDAFVPDMLAGLTMAEVGDRHDHLRDGADPAGVFPGLVDAACAAVQALEDPGRTVHCSFGDFTAQEYLWQVTSFRGLRAHDIAVVVGVDATLPADLVTGLLGQLTPVVEDWRALGVFPAAVEVPADAPPQDRLLAMTGRDPARR